MVIAHSVMHLLISVFFKCITVIASFVMHSFFLFSKCITVTAHFEMHLFISVFFFKCITVTAQFVMHLLISVFKVHHGYCTFCNAFIYFCFSSASW